jgi:protein disulfide-isomerase A6
MKPAWDKLGDEYKDSASVLIGDADCTASGKELCDQNEVRGYPTIKYFSAETGPKGSDYQGGRDFESLKQFVADTLEVKCLVDAPDGCSDKEKEFLAKWKGLPADEIAAQKTRLDGMVSGSMKPDLKKWVVQRLNILKQLQAA